LTKSVQLKPPAAAILRQNGLSSTCCCVTADLVNPGGGWPTTGTSPFLRWPLAISRLGTDSKDLTGWYSVTVCESGKVTTARTTNKQESCAIAKMTVRWPCDAPFIWVPLISLHRVGQESSSTGTPTSSLPKISPCSRALGLGEWPLGYE